MRKALYLTDRSLKDYRAIESYSQNKWSKAVSKQYLSKLELALELVSKNPEILRSDIVGFENLSFYRVEKHFLIFFLGKKEILLLTIIHSSRDLPAVLNEMLPSLRLEVEQLEKKLEKKLFK